MALLRAKSKIRLALADLRPSARHLNRDGYNSTIGARGSAATGLRLFLAPSSRTSTLQRLQIRDDDRVALNEASSPRSTRASSRPNLRAQIYAPKFTRMLASVDNR